MTTMTGHTGAAPHIQYPGYTGKVQLADKFGRLLGGAAVHGGNKPNKPPIISSLDRFLPNQSTVSNRIGQRIP